MRWSVALEVEVGEPGGAIQLRTMTVSVEADRPSQARQIAPDLLRRMNPELADRSVHVVSAEPLGDSNERIDTFPRSAAGVPVPTATASGSGQLLDLRSVASRLKVPLPKLQHAVALNKLPAPVSSLSGNSVWTESQLGIIAAALGVSWPPPQSGKKSSQTKQRRR
jgi:hypothetical protein